MEISNLDELVNRAFTFYDNEFNINLFPENVSENDFSLIENEVRNVITMNINLNDGSHTFIKNKIIVLKIYLMKMQILSYQIAINGLP